MQYPTCPFCGLPEDQWIENNGHGHIHAGVIYCSEACALAAEQTDSPPQPQKERPAIPLAPASRTRR